MKITEQEYRILKEKAELVQTDVFKKIVGYQTEMILDLAKSEINSDEIKGMLKLIAKTSDWDKTFINKTKE